MEHEKRNTEHETFPSPFSLLLFLFPPFFIPLCKPKRCLTEEHRLMIYDDKSFHPDMLENPEVHQKIIDALPIPIFYRDVNGVYMPLTVRMKSLLVYLKAS
jgi:hypothetical protein